MGVVFYTNSHARRKTIGSTPTFLKDVREMSKSVRLQENIYNVYKMLKTRKNKQDFLEKCFIFAWENKILETKDASVDIAFTAVKPSLKISETNENWGGHRDNAGRKNNQVENQDDYQDEIKMKSSCNQVSYKDISNKDISNKDKNIYTTEFDELWKEYPKQRAGNKQKAFNAYCRAMKRTGQESDFFLSAVRKYAESEEVKRGFAKGCEAWFNADKFNDNYDVEQSFIANDDDEKCWF
jgi:hypothetical protein